MAFISGLIDLVNASDITSLIMDRVNNSTTSKIMCTSNLRCSSSLTKQFYINESYLPVWSKDGQLLDNTDQLINILHDSYHEGLSPDNYHLNEIEKLHKRVEEIDPTSLQERSMLLADLDITLTDAFFLYASHQTYGQINNRQVYPQWNITKRSANLINIFDEALADNNIKEELDKLTPQHHGYNKLKHKLEVYQQIALNGGWVSIESGPTLHPGEHGKRVNQLQQRLNVTGELKQVNSKRGYDNAVKLAVSEFQKSHGLNADGIAGKATLIALNIPVNMRLQQIELNMDRLRYLPTDLGERYILVNIPDYSLYVIESDTIIMSMPVIVGKDEGLQSCVLSSKVTYLDLNPYWYIPRSITIRDVLPKQQQDPSYLSRNNIKIYTDYNNPNSEINPKSIKWSQMTADKFSYKLREDPGSDNPLGKIKFIFPNSCGIYLHDTSTPQLFKNSRRDLSHGCIRIGKPLELATYLLSDKLSWSRNEIESAINSGKNKAITLTTPMNIYIVYATAWVDKDDVLQFRNDIYNIDNIPYKLWLPKKGD